MARGNDARGTTARADRAVEPTHTDPSGAYTLRGNADGRASRPSRLTGLRRAAVDSLLRAGVDVGTACAILGHSPAVMLTRYRRATLDDARKAVLTARLGSVPAGAVPVPFVARRADS